MSSSVYPVLPGIAWSVLRTPMFSTVVKQTDSGREFARAAWTSPRYTYQLTYEFLRKADYETLKGFFCQMRGNFDTFLFEDPEDKDVTAEQFGTGDGTTTVFQLLRTRGGWADPVYEPHGTVNIYNNGTLVSSGVSIGANGVVTFTTPPAAAHLLTWTGSFYWRCRFTKTMMDFDQFMKTFWTVRRVEFITVKP